VPLAKVHDLVCREMTKPWVATRPFWLELFMGSRDAFLGRSAILPIRVVVAHPGEVSAEDLWHREMIRCKCA
jgi:hypothetical protein